MIQNLLLLQNGVTFYQITNVRIRGYQLIFVIIGGLKINYTGYWMYISKKMTIKNQNVEAARSFALLKNIALNIVRTKDTTPKRSLKRKLKHSAWDDSYLLNMLS